MDNPLIPENPDLAIEDALRTLPLASLPRTITGDVLAQIKAVPAPRSFHLTWSDIVLGMILSLSLSAIWFSLQNLPPIVVAQIRKESILFYQYLLVNARWLLPAVSFGLAGVLALLTLPYLKQELSRISE
ncbi:MAG TPA: hypothetical protein VK900_20140 [Anaerolineales bacterium]|nr:hypothetical protein [Anaerolineales bacterium]